MAVCCRHFVQRVLKDLSNNLLTHGKAVLDSCEHTVLLESKKYEDCHADDVEEAKHEGTQSLSPQKLMLYDLVGMSLPLLFFDNLFFVLHDVMYLLNLLLGSPSVFLKVFPVSEVSRLRHVPLQNHV